MIWGSTWIVIKEGLNDLPPFKSAGVRFAVAAIVMTTFAGWLSRKEGGASPPSRLWLVVGISNFATSYGIVYWSETRLPSRHRLGPVVGLSDVDGGPQPLLPPGRDGALASMAGFVFGLVGVVFLFFTDLRAFGPGAVPAALVLFVSPLVTAFSTVYLKRTGEGANSILLNRNAMWVGAGILCALGWTVERDSPAVWSGAAIASVAYLSLVGTVVTFGLYFWLLRHAAAHKLSLIAYVTPAIALLLGWSVGDEPITANTLTGSFLILVGVFLVAGGRPRSSARNALLPIRSLRRRRFLERSLVEVGLGVPGISSKHSLIDLRTSAMSPSTGMGAAGRVHELQQHQLHLVGGLRGQLELLVHLAPRVASLFRLLGVATHSASRRGRRTRRAGP